MVCGVCVGSCLFEALFWRDFFLGLIEALTASREVCGCPKERERGDLDNQYARTMYVCRYLPFCFHCLSPPAWGVMIGIGTEIVYIDDLGSYKPPVLVEHSSFTRPAEHPGGKKGVEQQ